MSEITIAELYYGASNSNSVLQNFAIVIDYIKKFERLAISNVLELFGEQKAYLKKSGQIIPEFDILIACTALHYDFVLVTHNTKHFSRFRNIRLEDWVIK